MKGVTGYLIVICFCLGAILACQLILVARAHGAEYRSATWYANHPTQRFQVNEACKNWPGESGRNSNCENAFQGGLIADARSAQSRMGGAANIGGPSLAWWRAHPQNRDYWANQCRIAMAHNEKPETLAGMWCPSVLAAGG
jgi:hypothetical protein